MQTIMQTASIIEVQNDPIFEDFYSLLYNLGKEEHMLMKYYPGNSSAIEYVEIPEACEKDGSTLIIQPKNYEDFVSLQCVLEMVKKEEISSMEVNTIPNKFQFRLALSENSNYLTLFRWLTNYKLMTCEFSESLYSAQLKKISMSHNHFKSPLIEKTAKQEVLQTPQDKKEDYASEKQKT